MLELSLSANELLLMAWGSNPLYDRVWKARGVRSLVVPTQAPPSYLSDDLVVTTLATSLPSVNYLRLDAVFEPADGASKLLRLLSGQLQFSSAPAPSLASCPLQACHALR